jgi:hypothetical protein
MNAHRYPGDGPSYGNRMAPSRPDSYFDAHHGNPNNRPSMHMGQYRRGFGPRNNSDPVMYGGNTHSMYSNQRREINNSYETATQGSGSGGSHGTEHWTNSTDPSSENSSVDRFQQPQPPKPDIGEAYGFTGFGGAPQTALEIGQHDAYGQHQFNLNRQPRKDLPPPPPPHSSGGIGIRQPRENTLHKRSSTYDAPSPIQRPATQEKRKSWLMRRFSKNG